MAHYYFSSTSSSNQLPDRLGTCPHLSRHHCHHSYYYRHIFTRILRYHNTLQVSNWFAMTIQSEPTLLCNSSLSSCLFNCLIVLRKQSTNTTIAAAASSEIYTTSIVMYCIVIMQCHEQERERGGRERESSSMVCTT